jgi:acyl carrier protein
MTHEELITRTEKAFTHVFGPKVPFDLTLSRLDESRWTSLKHVELLVALEEEFGIHFDGADATDMTSIPAVLERLRQRLS